MLLWAGGNLFIDRNGPFLVHWLVTLDIHPFDQYAVSRDSHAGLNGYNITDDQIWCHAGLWQALVATDHSNSLTSDRIVKCFVLAILTNLADGLQSDDKEACKDDGDALIKWGPVVIKDTDKQRSTACKEKDANHFILTLLKEYCSPWFQLWELLGVHSEAIVSEF